MSFYLQKFDSTWEEVDQYTWDHAGEALSPDLSGPRFNGNEVIKDENGISIKGQNFTNKDVAGIYRFVGIDIREVSQLTVPGGLVRQPEYIHFKTKKGSNIIRQLTSGTNFVAHKAA